MIYLRLYSPEISRGNVEGEKKLVRQDNVQPRKNKDLATCAKGNR